MSPKLPEPIFLPRRYLPCTAKQHGTLSPASRPRRGHSITFHAPKRSPTSPIASAHRNPDVHRGKIGHLGAGTDRARNAIRARRCQSIYPTFGCIVAGSAALEMERGVVAAELLSSPRSWRRASGAGSLQVIHTVESDAVVPLVGVGYPNVPWAPSCMRVPRHVDRSGALLAGGPPGWPESNAALPPTPPCGQDVLPQARSAGQYVPGSRSPSILEPV
jgi:hypothetical protein